MQQRYFIGISLLYNIIFRSKIKSNGPHGLTLVRWKFFTSRILFKLTLGFLVILKNTFFEINFSIVIFGKIKDFWAKKWKNVDIVIKSLAQILPLKCHVGLNESNFVRLEKFLPIFFILIWFNFPFLFL